MFFVLPVAAIIALAACNQKAETKAAEQQPEITAAEPETVNVKVSDLATPKDFICGMDVVDGSIADTASYEGKLYGFCSKECKAEFAKEPAKYVAQVK